MGQSNSSSYASSSFSTSRSFLFADAPTAGNSGAAPAKACCSMEECKEKEPAKACCSMDKKDECTDKGMCAVKTKEECKDKPVCDMKASSSSSSAAAATATATTTTTATGDKPKMCCACPETKKARDECVIAKGEDNCKELIEAHKVCLRKMGFNV